MPVQMDDRDKRLLNLLQSDFPLVRRPYAALGERLQAGEEEILARIGRLREEKIIRQISAIFDTRSLGYKSSLVAMRADPARVDEAAAVVNTHPGVSHNYKRNHTFNIWFTIAIPPQKDLEATVKRLHDLARAESTRILPTLRLFKIGVNLDMTGESNPAAIEEPVYSDKKREGADPAALTPQEMQAIRELQEDLPLTSAPFDPMAARMGITPEGLFAVAAELGRRGHLRRFAAVLHHRTAGFRANAMGVWKVPESRTDEVGALMGSVRGVSHCYLRPTYPDWPYNIFTMVHGRTVQECEEILGAISRTTGITDFAQLYSTKEYKKTRVRYFTDEYEAWERQYAA
ncbi:MAG TPA: AsnC family transcriptional regulator, partial [Candidatus Methylomirabilis sp.]|nr:AsnC family transcriptional regulator [Candidatus Methylomirabilis sp.]